jgi:hypothetical protein
VSRDPVTGRVIDAMAGRPQSWLANQLGVAQGVVQPWLADGKPIHAKYLARLPAILGVSGHWLLTGQGAPAEIPVDSVYEAGRQQGRREMWSELSREISATLSEVAGDDTGADAVILDQVPKGLLPPSGAVSRPAANQGS